MKKILYIGKRGIAEPKNWAQADLSHMGEGTVNSQYNPHIRRKKDCFSEIELKTCHFELRSLRFTDY